MGHTRLHFSDVPDLGGSKAHIKGKWALILTLPTMLCNLVLLLPTGGSNMWGYYLLGGGVRYELKPCFLPFENSLDIRG